MIAVRKTNKAPHHCKLCNWWHSTKHNVVCEGCECQIKNGEDIGQHETLTKKELSFLSIEVSLKKLLNSKN